jgi:hypothetical protein
VIYGFALFGVGLVLTTIGGFITMIRNPAAFNEQSRANFDPVRKDIPHDAANAFGKAQWHDAKAKWITRVGVAMGFDGILTIYVSADRLDSGNSQAKIGINDSLAASSKEGQ